MPEGDTIRRLAERIAGRFLGQRVQQSIARDPRITHLDLVGFTLVTTDAVGKHLLLRFEAPDREPLTVHAHLRMDGSFDLGRRSQVHEWKRRLEVEFENGWMTAIDMPILGAVPTAKEDSIVGHLGPDLCGAEEPDSELIAERLVDDVAAGVGDIARPLASTLLDQRNVAGFGNLYVVEVPFIAGVSPWQPVDTIDGLAELVAAGAALIRTNAQRGPQNTTGRRLTTSHHWIYGRKNQPCPWCSTRLRGAGERETPWQRVTTWCPECQPDTDSRTVDVERIERALILHPARKLFRPVQR